MKSPHAIRESGDGAPFARLFIAIEVSDEQRERLEAAARSLHRCAARVGWVPRENYHLSLAFLGNIARGAIADLALALDVAAAEMRAFPLQVHGVGWFGSESSPRVIWAGVLATDALVTLQARIAGLLRDAGIRLEDRPFHPHITLGRVRTPHGRAALVDAIRKLDSFEGGDTLVTRVVLMESRLTAGAASYRMQHASEFPAQHPPG